MKVAIEEWLKEPQTYCQSILDKFDFLIDGRAKKEIEVFIKKKPKFEEICGELEVYNKHVERTQEISSLEYFTFVRCRSDTTILYSKPKKSEMVVRLVVGW